MKKKPLVLQVDPEHPGRCPEALAPALACLREGGIVAFPTETFYGLAVDPTHERALAALFRLKKRDPQKPLLVLIGDTDQLAPLVRSVPAEYRKLMNTFWPGPLTLIFPARRSLSPLLTGGTGSVGIRISSHPVAAEFCRLWKGAITATSANISGMLPAANAEAVESAFGSPLDCIIDGGETPGALSSTIVGIRRRKIHLIREGPIAFSRILSAL